MSGFTVAGASFQILTTRQPDHGEIARCRGDLLTLMPCGIAINLKTGEVDLPRGLSIERASVEFWRTMERLAPMRGFGR
jgi:hypothetical protein